MDGLNDWVPESSSESEADDWIAAPEDAGLSATNDDWIPEGTELRSAPVDQDIAAPTALQDQARVSPDVQAQRDDHRSQILQQELTEEPNNQALRQKIGFDERRRATAQQDEARFQSWYKGHASALGLNQNPDDPQHFYDYRGAFREGAGPGPDGHWPSKFKREGHPRMVLEGVNTKTGQREWPAGISAENQRANAEIGIVPTGPVMTKPYDASESGRIDAARQPLPDTRFADSGGVVPNEVPQENQPQDARGANQGDIRSFENEQAPVQQPQSRWSLDTPVPKPKTEFTKGIESGITGAQQLGVAAMTLPTMGALKTLADENQIFDAIDQNKPPPEATSSFLAQRARMYASSSPEMRKQLRDHSTRRIVEHEGFKSELIDQWRRYEAQLKTQQGRVPNFTDASDLDGFADWLTYASGNSIPYLGVSMLAGILGGIPALALTGYTMGAGEIQGELIKEGREQEGARALVGAIPYAALEFLGPAGRVVRGSFMSSKALTDRVARSYFQRLGREIPANAIEEFINEAGQEIVKDVSLKTGTDQPIVNDKALLAWFNAGMSGLVGGTTASPVAILATEGDTSRPTQPPPRIEPPMGGVPPAIGPAEPQMGNAPPAGPGDPTMGAPPDIAPTNEPTIGQEIADLQAILDSDRPVAEVMRGRQAAAQPPVPTPEDVQAEIVQADQRAAALAEQYGIPGPGQRAVVTWPDGTDMGGEVVNVYEDEGGGWRAQVRSDDGQIWDTGEFDSKIRLAPGGDGTKQSPVEISDPADIAVASQQVDPDPTPAQKEAENFKMGHLKFAEGHPFAGLPEISIETAKGGTRTAKNGSWSVPDMPADYGRFKGTVGMDGDHLDAFVGDGEGIFIIDQIDAETGKPDEHKVMLGFESEQAARAVYERAFADGKGAARIGAITQMPVAQFRQWIKNGDLTKPLAYSQPAEEDIQDAIDMTRPKRKVTRNRPLHLLEFLAKRGGIREEGGELTARYALGMFAPGFGRVVRKNGMSFDAAREAAAEAGYLPMDSDVNDFLELIDRALAEEKVWNVEGQQYANQVDALEREKNEIYVQADEFGIDTRRKSFRQVEQLVRAAIETERALSAMNAELELYSQENENGEEISVGSFESEAGTGEPSVEQQEDNQQEDQARGGDGEVGNREGVGDAAAARQAVDLAYKEASKDFAEAQRAYRAREIGDSEFLAVRKRFNDAMAAVDAADEFNLAAETPAQLRLKAEREKRDAEEKRQQQQEPGEFVLSGSSRPADVAVSMGQQEFGADRYAVVGYSRDQKADDAGGPEYNDPGMEGGQRRRTSLKKGVRDIVNETRKRNEVPSDVEIRLADLLEMVDAQDQFDGRPKQRVRGPLWVRERVIRAQRFGELSDYEAEFVLWLLDQNNDLATDLGISIRGSKNNERMSGFYNKVGRIFVLLTDKVSATTGVHEILHHTERMMPDDVRSGIVAEWLRQVVKQIKDASPERAAALLDQMELSLTGSPSKRVAVVSAYARGVLKHEDYQFTNASEFWAVNGTRILEGRFNADSWIAQAKRWLKEFVEKVKAILGLKSDAPVIKALEAIIAGDGKFTTKDMLAESKEFFNRDNENAGVDPVSVDEPESEYTQGREQTDPVSEASGPSGPQVLDDAKLADLRRKAAVIEKTARRDEKSPTLYVSQYGKAVVSVDALDQRPIPKSYSKFAESNGLRVVKRVVSVNSPPAQSIDRASGVRYAHEFRSVRPNRATPGEVDELYAIGDEAQFSDAFLAQRDQIVQKIHDMARRIAPKAQLVILNRMFGQGKALERSGAATAQPREVPGSYTPAVDLITVALRYSDPYQTLRHETIHHLKEVGLFTEAEWSILESRSNQQWMTEHNVPDVEEGIAYAFGDYKLGRRFGGLINRAFAKLEDFLQKIGNMLRGRGFDSVESIFSRIESGEIGAREDMRMPARLHKRGPVGPKYSIGSWYTRTRQVMNHRHMQAFVSALMRSNRHLTVWQRTVGTKYHTALELERKGKPQFKRVFDYVQNFLQDISALALTAEEQATSIFRPVRSPKDFFRFGASKEDLDKLSRPLIDGTLHGGGSPLKGRVWSDPELRRLYGLTPKQIALYKEARAAIDQSLTDVSKALLAKNAQVAHVGYDRTLPLSEMADEIVLALNSREEYLQEKLEEATEAGDDLAMATWSAQIATVREIKKAIPEIVEKTEKMKEAGYFPLMRFGEYFVEVRDEEDHVVFFGLEESATKRNMIADALTPLFPGFVVQTGIMSKERAQLFQGANIDSLEIFQKYIRQDNLSDIQEYLRHAVNTRSAMKRMIHRKAIEGYSEDIRRALARFITSNARHASTLYWSLPMKTAADEMPNTDGDIQDEAIRLVKYVLEGKEEAAAIRGYLFYHYLGGSIASAITNLSQTLAMTAPYLTQYANPATVSQELTKAAKVAVMDPKKVDGDLGVSLRKAEEEGITAPQEIYQLTAMASDRLFATNPTINAALRTWGLFWSATETFNRRVAFVAAYRIAVKNGMHRNEAYRFAEKTVKATQGIYNKGNRPNWGRGPVGATIFTFKQYSVMFLELFKRMPMKQKILMLVLLWLMAGLEGLPFYDDALDLFDTLREWLAGQTNTKGDIRDAVGEVSESLFGEEAGKQVSNLVLHGLSGISPIDVSARLGLANLIPGTGLLKQSQVNKWEEIEQVLGVAASLAAGILDAAGAIVESNWWRAGRAALPVGAANILVGGEAMKTGEIKDYEGRKMMDVTFIEALAKTVGFNPQVVAAESRVRKELRQEENFRKVHEEKIVNMIVRGRLNEDEALVDDANKQLDEWNDSQPDHMQILINAKQINDRVKASRRTSAERFIKAMPKESKGRAREQLQDLERPEP